MLRFFTEAKITELNYELRKEKGWPQGCRVYMNDDKRWLYGWATVLLVPEKRLDRDTKYTISIKCKVDGTPFEKKWSFTTRAK